jgi:signal transduction histidine kinase
MILRQLFQAGSDPRYREERVRLDVWRARILSGYCAVLYPSFWFLDLVVYPERARLFGLMRAGVVALAVPLLIVTYMAPRPWIAPAARMLAVMATTAVGYMCAATEGFRSNYVIGVIICLMAISTIELFHMAQLLAVHGGVLVSYAGMNRWLAPHPATPDVVSSLAFLSGASCFCIVASGLLEYQRHRLFEAQALLGVRNGELERANQHQREFLRTITHELRTPLNATLGFVDLIRESEAQLSTANLRRLERISGGSRRLLQIINDILDLSKIEAEVRAIQCLRAARRSGTVDARPPSSPRRGGRRRGASGPDTPLRRSSRASDLDQPRRQCREVHAVRQHHAARIRDGGWRRGDGGR